MRALLFAALLLLPAACAGSGPGATPADPAGGAAMAADLLPFEASSAPFLNARDGSARTLRVVPAADGQSARLVLDSGAGAPSEIRVTRADDGLWFSADVDKGTRLIQFGANPGDEWESAGRRVRFDGWEPASLGGASIEAARITARRGPASLEHVETWWFARGVGLVRLKSDRGSLSVDELVRAGR
jgi:hypothetical protein